VPCRPGHLLLSYLISYLLSKLSAGLTFQPTKDVVAARCGDRPTDSSWATVPRKPRDRPCSRVKWPTRVGDYVNKDSGCSASARPAARTRSGNSTRHSRRVPSRSSFGW
jgi:hypothetical protein